MARPSPNMSVDDCVGQLEDLCRTLRQCYQTEVCTLKGEVQDLRTRVQTGQHTSQSSPPAQAGSTGSFLGSEDEALALTVLADSSGATAAASGGSPREQEDYDVEQVNLPLEDMQPNGGEHGASPRRLSDDKVVNGWSEGTGTNSKKSSVSMISKMEVYASARQNSFPRAAGTPRHTSEPSGSPGHAHLSIPLIIRQRQPSFDSSRSVSLAMPMPYDQQSCMRTACPPRSASPVGRFLGDAAAVPSSQDGRPPVVPPASIAGSPRGPSKNAPPMASCAGRRESLGAEDRCEGCGSEYAADADFCRKCGAPRTSHAVATYHYQVQTCVADGRRCVVALNCHKCLNFFLSDAIYCRKCGARRQGPDDDSDELSEDRSVEKTKFYADRYCREKEASLKFAAAGKGKKKEKQIQEDDGDPTPVTQAAEQGHHVHFGIEEGSESSDDKEEEEEEGEAVQASRSSLGSMDRKMEAIRKSGCQNALTPGKNKSSRAVGSMSDGVDMVLIKPVWEECLNGVGLQRRPSAYLGNMCESCVDLEAEDVSGPVLRPFMLSPTSMKAVMFALCGLLLIGYDCLTVPLEVFEPPPNLFSKLMEWLLRIFWTVNMVISFFTGYITDDGSTELRPVFVWRNYVRSWFMLDVFVVAFDWADFTGTVTQSGVQKVGTAFRTVRLIRTVRLVRLLRAPQISKAISELVPLTEQVSLTTSIAKGMLLFFWIAHIVACIFYLIGIVTMDGGSWISKGEFQGLRDEDLASKYTVSLFWSIRAFSGEVSTVENIEERIFACCVLFLAFLVSAAYVGSITTSMTRLQLIASEQSSKVAVLRRFLMDNHISRPLALRVQRNATHAMNEQKSNTLESNVELLALCSTPVMMELHFEIHFHIISEHPFFLAYHSVNPAGIKKVCHTAVTTMSYHTGDILFNALEVPSEPKMMFVMSGSVMYHLERQNDNTRKRAQVPKGSWLSEGCLWAEWRHQGTAKCQNELRVLALDAEKFTEVVHKFPSEHASIYAVEFVDWHNAEVEDRLSDIAADKNEVLSIVTRSFPNDDDDAEEESDSDEEEEDQVGGLRTSESGEDERYASQNSDVKAPSFQPRRSQFGKTGTEQRMSMASARQSRMSKRVSMAARQSRAGVSQRPSIFAGLIDTAALGHRNSMHSTKSVQELIEERQHWRQRMVTKARRYWKALRRRLQHFAFVPCRRQKPKDGPRGSMVVPTSPRSQAS
eukprot:TRINITY_DN19679_c0_g1_i1.p1 TRINITY_DN19679_c0_g1~~TRINITY_DN19679_c0_g1_i1.p1  ORF type:complete len:1213 (+),score=273.59 TRINITY_DN19679_c0_g1_i1:134-3772(+)